MASSNPFDGLARDYAAHRPGYPDAVLQHLSRQLPADTRLALIDVGAGTGIASRALAAAFSERSVVALEPGADMRRDGIRAAKAIANLSYLAGQAELLPFAPQTAALVLAAQAVHWFDRGRFYEEALRVLTPGGVLALLANNRDARHSKLLQDYEEFLERVVPGYQRDYRDLPLEAELSCLEGCDDPVILEISWERALDYSGFIGLAASTSYLAPVLQGASGTEIAEELRALLKTHAGNGRVQLPYRARLLSVRKSG